MSNHELLTCEEAIRLLASYIDRELDGDNAEQLERHLELCRSCHARHEFEKGLKDRISQLGEEPVSTDFADRIRGLVARYSAEGPDAERD